jgi:hypothetical protein
MMFVGLGLEDDVLNYWVYYLGGDFAFGDVET